MLSLYYSYFCRNNSYFGGTKLKFKKFNFLNFLDVLGKREDLYVINLKNTLYSLKISIHFLINLMVLRGKILSIEKRPFLRSCIIFYSRKSRHNFYAQRWVGGLFTSFHYFSRIIIRFKELMIRKGSILFGSLKKKHYVLNLKNYKKKKNRLLLKLKSNKLNFLKLKISKTIVNKRTLTFLIYKGNLNIYKKFKLIKENFFLPLTSTNNKIFFKLKRKKVRLKILKEQIKQIETYKQRFYGIHKMKRLPDLLFFLDTKENETAVNESLCLGIPIISLFNVFYSRTSIAFPIPINSENLHPIIFYLKTLYSSIIIAKKKEIFYFFRFFLLNLRINRLVLLNLLLKTSFFVNLEDSKKQFNFEFLTSNRKRKFYSRFLFNNNYLSNRKLSFSAIFFLPSKRILKRKNFNYNSNFNNKRFNKKTSYYKKYKMKSFRFNQSYLNRSSNFLFQPRNLNYKRNISNKFMNNFNITIHYKNRVTLNHTKKYNFVRSAKGYNNRNRFVNNKNKYYKSFFDFKKSSKKCLNLKFKKKLFQKVKRRFKFCFIKRQKKIKRFFFAVRKKKCVSLQRRTSKICLMKILKLLYNQSNKLHKFNLFRINFFDSLFFKKKFKLGRFLFFRKVTDKRKNSRLINKKAYLLSYKKFFYFIKNQGRYNPNWFFRKILSKPFFFKRLYKNRRTKFRKYFRKHFFKSKASRGFIFELYGKVYKRINVITKSIKYDKLFKMYKRLRDIQLRKSLKLNRFFKRRFKFSNKFILNDEKIRKVL